MPVDDSPKGDYAVSVVRTVTPFLVGLIVGTFGSEIAGLNEATLTPIISGIVGAAYYAAVRALEHKWPKMGVLLGWVTTPTYSKPQKEQVDNG